MTWAATATLGTAALGAYTASENRKAQQKANEQNSAISAAQQEFSPWTKMQAQPFSAQSEGPSVLGGAAKGALGGVMFGQDLKKNIAEGKKLDAEMEQAKAAAELEKMRMAGTQPQGGTPWDLGGYASGFNPNKYGVK